MVNRILKLLLITFLFIFPIQLVFSSIPQSLPAPTHTILFGYYHVDSQYGDFKDEVKDYTNTQIITQESFLRSDLNNIQEFNSAFGESIALGHKIVYVLGTDWNQGFNAVKPYWSNVEFIYLADEPNWDKTTTEANITNFKNLVTQAGLAQKQIAINYTPQQIQTGTGYQATNLDIIGFEAYVDPANQNDPNILTTLNTQIDGTKQKIGNKKMFIILQAYDRNGVWKNMTSLQDIQIPPYLNAYNDNNVIGLFMFSYARPGGTKDNPTLKEAHQLIGNTLLGQGPIELTITDATTGWNGSMAFNPSNNTWVVVSQHYNGSAILARLLDNNGNPLTSMTTVDQEPTFFTGAPKIAYSPDTNKLLVVWVQENNTQGTSGDIYGRFMSADGALLGNAFNLTPNDPRVPNLLPNSIMQYDSRNKKFVFVFENRAPGNVPVYLKTVGVDGTVGPTLAVTENPPDFFGAPSLVVNEKDNEYCVSYQNSSANQPNKLSTNSSSLAIKRIDASTMQVGAETFASNDLYFNGNIVYNIAEDTYFATWTNYAITSTMGKTLNSCDGTDTDDAEDIVLSDNTLSGIASYNPKSNTYAIISTDCCNINNNYLVVDTALNTLEQGTIFTDSRKSDPSTGGNFAPVIMANTNNGTYSATSSVDYATTRFASNVGSAVLLGRTYNGGGSGFPPPLVLGVPSEGLPTDLGQLIEAIFSWSLALIGLVIFVRFFYAGFLWFTAAGNTTKTGQAMEIMKHAVYGALVLFSAWLILNTINPDLVGGTFKLPGLSGTAPTSGTGTQP